MSNHSHISALWRAPFSQMFCFDALRSLNGNVASVLNAPWIQAWQIADPQNARVNDKRVNNHRGLPEFVEQDEYLQDPRYYEQIIFDDQKVPTRSNSWHDLFNALIWKQFPHSKAYFNALHVQDIQQFGVHPRTKVRNNLTLFDECGVLIISDQADFAEHLAKHNWHEIFVQRGDAWGSSIIPIIIGHANWEMLLTPHIGLTAKALVIEVENARAYTDWQTQPAQVDTLLLEYLQQTALMSRHRPFMPLPLLGIPGWHFAQQDDDFYADANYFMPRSSIKTALPPA